DERQSHVWAAMAWSYRQHGDLDEALAAGTRALEIAERREDLEGRLFAASGLVELYWFRGELFGAIELAHKIVAVLPPNWALRNPRGMAIPASIFTRFLMIHSLAGLGSFTEAAVREVETTQLAESTQHPFTIGLVDQAATALHVGKGDWAQARSRT